MMKIVGIHAVTAAIQAGQGRRLLVKDGKPGARVTALMDLARGYGCDVVVTDWQGESIEVADQGVALEVNEPAYRSEKSLFSDLETRADQAKLYLVLDGVTDPRNFGACLRSAVTFGVDGVIVPKDNAAPMNDAAIKTASGAASLVAVYQVVNLARCLRELKKRNVWVVGTVLDGDQSLGDVDLAGDIALVLGAEETGIRLKTRETCDFLAKIPSSYPDLSLNVSVAAGICLYEARKQRS